MKKRKHLSIDERSIIERLVQAGKSNKSIAEVLGWSVSTIGRDLERNCWRLKCRTYRSEHAERIAKKRRKHERKSRISGEIWQKIFGFYNEDWSPEQISGALKLKGICVSHETIYRRIYAEIKAGRLDRKHLRWNRKKRRRRLSKRSPRDLTKISIENRPNISSRTEFGHWEGDTVELIRGQSYLVTMVERKTRFTLVGQVPNKKSDTVRNAILSMFRHFPKAVKSITLDNGTEFADHKIIANRLNATVYFAHPHCPWERGIFPRLMANGHCPAQGRALQYFPKKTKATYTSAYLADCRQKINMRPRKCLNFASPAQHFSCCLKLLQGGGAILS